MDSNKPMSVGRLVVMTENPDDSGVCELYHGKELLIGRHEASCELTLTDPTVSNQHLKVYSVIFDQSDPSSTEPLIYAEDLSSNGSYWNGSLIGKGNGGVLLSDGDEIRISPRIVLVFEAAMKSADETVDNLHELEKKHFNDTYMISKRKLGAGGFGKVYMAVHHASGRQLACKIVDLRQVRRQEALKLQAFLQTSKATALSDTSTDPAKVIAKMSEDAIKRKVEETTGRYSREVDILKDLNHPNVVRLEKVYQSENTLYIFEELFTGGDLYSYIEYKGGHLNEAEAGIIVRQVLKGLEYLHVHDIVHRDLKPDNLLIVSLVKTARVVLTDFGSAIKVRSINKSWSRRMETHIGTLEYVAPEVKGMNKLVSQRGYTSAVDLWSLGCVTVALLIGHSPFEASRGRNSRQNTFEAITNAAAECSLNDLDAIVEWRAATPRAKDFVQSLVILDEKARMTASEALDHHWFTNEAFKGLFDAAYCKALREYKPRIPAMDIIETIKVFATPKRPSIGPRTPRAKKQKMPRPIEPHYQPYHKSVDQLLSPVRMQMPLPSITEVNEDIGDKAREISKESFDEIGIMSIQTPEYVLDSSAIDLPAVETLQLSDTCIQKIPASQRFSAYSFDGMVQSSRTGLVARKTLLTSRTDEKYASVSDSPPDVPFIPDSQMSLALTENESLGNIGMSRPNPDPGPLIDVEKVPGTPVRRLKRPRIAAQAHQKVVNSEGENTQSRKRQRKNIFDFEDDYEQFQNIEGSRQAFDTAFTPINRRQSVRLGDVQEREGTPASQIGSSSTGRLPLYFDVSLVGEERSESSNHPDMIGRMYNSLNHARGEDSTRTIDQDSGVSTNIATEEAPLGQSKRRRSSVFDYEEHAIYIDAGRE